MKRYATLILLFLSLYLNAQPVNDTCSGAISLTVGAENDRVNTLVTLDNTATDSGAGDPGCANYLGGDLWYKAIIPSTGFMAVVTSTSGGPINNTGLAIYFGDCGSLSLYRCNHRSGAGFFSKVVVPGTPGETVYIRVWENKNDTTGTFNICAYAVTPPANDTCSGAVPLTVGAEDDCVNTLVDLVGTESDSGIGDPSCSGFYDGGDLWYSFTMPASGMLAAETSNAGFGNINTEIAAYSGDCGSLVALECDQNSGVDSFSRIIVTKTPGSTIYLRVWRKQNDDLASFNLCAYEIAPPPAHDTCSGAIALTVGAENDCVNTLVTLDNTATDSGAGDPGCANYNGGDLWFQFTMPASGAVVVETSQSDGSITDTGMATYTADCASLVLDQCNDDGGVAPFSRIVVEKDPGITIYVRIWEYGNNNFGNFNICVYEIYTPVNDTCNTATELTVDSGGLCTTPVQVNYNETSTDSGVPDPGCGGYTPSNPGGDLWYRFTMPASGDVVVKTSESDGSILNTVLATYTTNTDCGGLSLDKCNLNGGTDFFSRIAVNETPGTMIYVRVWEFDNNKFGNFNICVYETYAPVNDTCNTATELTVDPGGFCTSPVQVPPYNELSSDSGVGNPGCGNYNPSSPGGDLWYKFTMPASGKAVVETSESDGSIINTALATYTGDIDCGGLELDQCNSDGGIGSFSKIEVNKDPGIVIYARVWEFNNDEFGTFNVCVYEPPPANNEQSGAVALPLGTPGTVTIDSAVTDSGVADPGCGAYGGGDLWYKVPFALAGDITVETSNSGGGILETGLAAYTKDMETLTLEACDDDSGTDSYSKLTVTGDVGSVFFFRVWEEGNDLEGSFNITATQTHIMSNSDFESLGFSISPNPPDRHIDIRFSNAVVSEGKLALYDLNGRLIRETDIAIENNRSRVDVSELPQGLYFVRIAAGDAIGVSRIVKK